MKTIHLLHLQILVLKIQKQQLCGKLFMSILLTTSMSSLKHVNAQWDKRTSIIEIALGNPKSLGRRCVPYRINGF